MWAIDNRTPYAAERTWVRDKDGAHRWIVAVKATWLVGEDGALSLAEEQAPPLYAAEYEGEPGQSSVRYEADLTAMKPGTDVLLRASAYAPGGRARESVEVSMRVGPVRKELVVFGPRIYGRGITGLSPGSAEPFVVQPIRYEHAWGGSDTRDPDPRYQGREPRNPVGRGFSLDSGVLVGEPAHQVERAGGPATEPAGFGPVGPHWSPRIGYAGTYDDAWFQHRRPLLPEDYDDRFTMCAPEDQQVIDHLRGGEEVELVNLDPTGRMRFRLPKVYLTFSTRILGRKEEHRSRLVTVLLEPDERRVVTVWQTSLLVMAHEVDYLDATIVREKPYLS